MDSLTVSKKELCLGLVAATTIPMLSFYLGFISGDHTIDRTITESAATVEQKSSTVSVANTEPTNGAAGLQVAQASLLSDNETVRTPYRHPEENLKPGDSIGILPEGNVQKVRSDQMNDATGMQFQVQVGAFSASQNAERFLDDLSQSNPDARIDYDLVSERPVYRVVIGTFESRKHAVQFRDVFKLQHGINGYVREVQPQPVAGLDTNLATPMNQS